MLIIIKALVKDHCQKTGSKIVFKKFKVTNVSSILSFIFVNKVEVFSFFSVNRERWVVVFTYNIYFSTVFIRSPTRLVTIAFQY